MEKFLVCKYLRKEIENDKSSSVAAYYVLQPSLSDKKLLPSPPDENKSHAGMRACPECHQQFDGVKCTPIKEACGHIKCRGCFIRRLPCGDNYCHQCEGGRLQVKTNHESTLRSVSSKFQVEPISMNVPLNLVIDKKSKIIDHGPFKSFLTPSGKNEVPPFSHLTRSQSTSSKHRLTEDLEESLALPIDLTKKIEAKPQHSNSVDNKQKAVKVEKNKFQLPVRKSKKQVAGITRNRKSKERKRDKLTLPGFIQVVIVENNSIMYRCNFCKKTFKTKSHVKYHRFCDSRSGEKPFKCEECGGRFVAKSHYQYHLRTHTGERPYKCVVCGKGFNQQGKVTRHMKSHTGERPFKCQHCGKGFANPQALKTHFVVHTGERPFHCKDCHKRFTNMTNLKKHIVIHTGEKPFSCDICGKSFGLKWTLNLHQRTHSTDRPYKCNQCTRAFTNSKDLRRHLVIHTGERPFKCWICGAAVRRKDNLDRHVKQVHNPSNSQQLEPQNEILSELTLSTASTIDRKTTPTSSRHQTATKWNSAKIKETEKSLLVDVKHHCLDLALPKIDQNQAKSGRTEMSKIEAEKKIKMEFKLETGKETDDSLSTMGSENEAWKQHKSRITQNPVISKLGPEGMERTSSSTAHSVTPLEVVTVVYDKQKFPNFK